MKGCDSTKIEAVGDSPTDQLNDAFCCLNNIPLKKERILLNRQDNSETDTSSIALTNYNIDCTSEFSTPTIEDSTLINDTLLKLDSLSFPFRYSTPTIADSTLPLKKNGGLVSLSFRFPFQRSSVETVSCFEYYSQTMACIATSFRECGLFTTALDKLWYVYSYIYIQFSSNATTIMLLLFFVLAILMRAVDRYMNINTTVVQVL